MKINLFVNEKKYRRYCIHKLMEVYGSPIGLKFKLLNLLIENIGWLKNQIKTTAEIELIFSKGIYARKQQEVMVNLPLIYRNNIDKENINNFIKNLNEVLEHETLHHCLSIEKVPSKKHHIIINQVKEKNHERRN